jgi:hypothetical protein
MVFTRAKSLGSRLISSWCAASLGAISVWIAWRSSLVSACTRPKKMRLTRVNV